MDKYILITNANTEVGSELIKTLISENYIVIAADANFENKKFGNLIYLTLDGSDYKSLENAKKNIQKYTSNINAIIHITNYVAYSPIIEVDDRDFMDAVDKLFVNIFRTNKVMWSLLNQKNGKIIHDCSDIPINDLVPYNGVVSLNKSLLNNYNDILRRELRFRGINVIKIHTGILKDENYKLLRAKYLKDAEESKLFFSDMSRFVDLNIPKKYTVSVNQYCELIKKIMKTKTPKRVYYLNANKTLKFIKRLPAFLKDMYFKNYQK